MQSTTIPETMRAAAIDQFGGPEELHVQPLPVPEPGPDQVLIRLDTAGIGVWDPYVRSGELKLGGTSFPLVIGNDGAGTVVAVGDRVKRFRAGDRVYAYALAGGFYAEYVAVKQDEAAAVPSGLATDQAGALGCDGITALAGLDDQLHLRAGQTLMVYGASGGIGHVAVQLAKRIGAEVFAVASGPDGVALAKSLGADAVADGRRDDVAEAARAFAPEGLDAALILAGGPRVDEALGALKEDGRVAYPKGVEPAPERRKGISVRGYDGVPSPEKFERLNQLVGAGPFRVELGHVYRLDEAEQAHREIDKHHLGKLALRLH
jgi:NADPH:quinone reductase-like Zn-dependent oxidoreductase